MKINVTYSEDLETNIKMDRLLPKQGKSLFIRKLTSKAIKKYEVQSKKNTKK